MTLRAEWMVAACVLLPGTAWAYIGPGGGLTLLTTALAMLAAFSVSAVVVLSWPIRAFKRWLRRRRGEPDDKQD